MGIWNYHLASVELHFLLDSGVRLRGPLEELLDPLPSTLGSLSLLLPLSLLSLNGLGLLSFSGLGLLLRIGLLRTGVLGEGLLEFLLKLRSLLLISFLTISNGLSLSRCKSLTKSLRALIS